MTQQQTPEELRREIERTRRELGDTVEALSHRVDVREQARRPLLLVGGLVAAFVVLRLVRRR